MSTQSITPEVEVEFYSEYGCDMTRKQYHAVEAVVATIHAAGPTSAHATFMDREPGPYYYSIDESHGFIHIFVGQSMRKVTVCRDGRVF